MNTYLDHNGNLCEAFCANGPVTLNTINGEYTACEGQWVIRNLNTGEVAVLNEDKFNELFTRG